MNDNLLLSFYLLKTGDHMGRTLDTYWQQDDRWQEQTHDYIQWMFPLFTVSRHNPHAPQLDEEAREAFIQSASDQFTTLQANLRRSLTTMFAFYGYKLDHHQVIPSAGWNRMSSKWLNNGNHNHLRISRILRCANLLGQPRLAKSFYDALHTAARSHPSTIPDDTLELWRQAVQSIPV